MFGNDNWGTRVNGTEPQYFEIRDWPLAEGTPFTQEDVEKNVVRGQYTAGVIGSQQQKGYKEEKGVSPNSITET